MEWIAYIFAYVLGYYVGSGKQTQRTEEHEQKIDMEHTHGGES